MSFWGLAIMSFSDLAIMSFAGLTRESCTSWHFNLYRCQNYWPASAFCVTVLNKPTPPWRGARSALQSNGAIAEPRNGGDAMLLAVELAKA